jgi:hypothetical protein
MYTIEVEYQTGNSFHSSVETSEIGLVFTTREYAQKALAVIKEHNDLYTSNESWENRHKSFKEVNKNNNKMHWCIKAVEISNNKYINDCDDRWKFLCAVEVADGEWRKMNVSMWTGYFEELRSADVISVGDSKDSISF